MRQQRINIYENKLKRDFRAQAPNQKWLTDISYIHTNEGVRYLSAILDAHDNFIVAYDMGTIQDNVLVYRTIKQAKTLINNYIHFYNHERIQLKYGLTPFFKWCQTA